MIHLYNLNPVSHESMVMAADGLIVSNLDADNQRQDNGGDITIQGDDDEVEDPEIYDQTYVRFGAFGMAAD